MGTTYTFRVRARNSVGYSEYSNEVAIKTFSVPDAPADLQYIAAESNDVQISLSWNVPINDGDSPIIDYRV